MPAICALVVLSLCIPHTWPEQGLSITGGTYVETPNGRMFIAPTRDGRRAFNGPNVLLTVGMTPGVAVMIDKGEKACSIGRCVIYDRECSSRTNCEYKVSYGGRGGGYRFALEANTAEAYRQAERDVKILLTDDDETGIPLASLKTFRRVKPPEPRPPVPEE